MSEAQVLESRGSAADPDKPWRKAPLPLAQRLDARIEEFLGAGDTIVWIEAEQEALVRLFLEAGEDVVSLDPDPSKDLAWYRDYEFRACPRRGLWVYRQGPHGHLSGHVVA